MGRDGLKQRSASREGTLVRRQLSLRSHLHGPRETTGSERRPTHGPDSLMGRSRRTWRLRDAKRNHDRTKTNLITIDEPARNRHPIRPTTSCVLAAEIPSVASPSEPQCARGDVTHPMRRSTRRRRTSADDVDALGHGYLPWCPNQPYFMAGAPDSTEVSACSASPMNRYPNRCIVRTNVG